MTITVSWRDGVSVHTESVTCDRRPAAIAARSDRSDGWASGPHPVGQIEPVPSTRRPPLPEAGPTR